MKSTAQLIAIFALFFSAGMIESFASRTMIAFADPIFMFVALMIFIVLGSVIFAAWICMILLKVGMKLITLPFRLLTMNAVDDRSVVLCTNRLCKHPNASAASFCSRCGSRMRHASQTPSQVWRVQGRPV